MFGIIWQSKASTRLCLDESHLGCFHVISLSKKIFDFSSQGVKPAAFLRQHLAEHDFCKIVILHVLTIIHLSG